MRGKPAPKRNILPDPKYRNTMVAKFINYIMREGKKATAQAILYSAFDRVKERINIDPLDVFDTAIKNIAPLVEVRGRRVGGANYQIPFPVRGERKYALAFRWILAAARNKKRKSMAEKLADEFVAAFNKEGDAMKKRNDVHKMAESNRAFAHFARFSKRKK
ncbi:30S ribosomal protein S7 [Candidatus Uhrbacteria bacterium]|nr:30S ribosomal protein S7 [Candidatus Uhrbacteria bacterium]